MGVCMWWFAIIIETFKLRGLIIIDPEMKSAL